MAAATETTSLLAEIPEADASGETARIYEEMRVTCARPSRRFRR
jgi:hypothetical protein